MFTFVIGCVVIVLCTLMTVILFCSVADDPMTAAMLIFLIVECVYVIATIIEKMPSVKFVVN